MLVGSTCTTTLRGPILQRGFRLHVWQVEIPKGEMLDLERTADNASPHATTRYARMGAHPAGSKTRTAMRGDVPSRGDRPGAAPPFAGGAQLWRPARFNAACLGQTQHVDPDLWPAPNRKGLTDPAAW
ncbi:hypothetical protein [Thiohalocapsa sp. ML1]|uniref:hypothetical protein n=1 Tax=Thiohalocapsa sp. ML1 TaxID=1431688 RepID=UPI0012E3E14C|nr:hypothetical protein [Thiohalocapsa sp. ML1]